MLKPRSLRYLPLAGFVLWIFYCLFQFQKSASNSEILMGVIPAEYLGVFQEDKVEFLSADVTYSNKLIAPITLYTYKKGVSIVLFSVKVKADTKLSSLVTFNKVKKESMPSVSYLIANEDLFEISYNNYYNISKLASQIAVNYTGSNFSMIKRRDSLLVYNADMNAFSMNFHNQEDMFVNPKQSSRINYTIAFKQKGATVYIFLISSRNQKSPLDNDDILKILE